MRFSIRSGPALSAAAVLVMASLTSAVTAYAGQHRHAALTGGSALTAAQHPGASDVPNIGATGWSVLSSASTSATGAQISTPGFSTAGWLPVTNDDAGAPGTEVEALAQNGQCPGDTALQPVNQSDSGPNSVFFSSNIQS